VDVVNLLLHPVRLRIVHALSGGQELTTGELAERLPEVAKVTMYRQIALLADAGFLEVTDEKRVRGAVERRYRLRQDRPSIGADDAGTMTAEEHRLGFAAAAAVLVAEFDRYLDDGADPVEDGVSYRQGVLWLTREELDEVTTKIVEILQEPLANRAAPGRRPYLLSPIIFPTGPARESPPRTPPEPPAEDRGLPRGGRGSRSDP
jgi:DNA-binding transcriptional ArsR family regulator